MDITIEKITSTLYLVEIIYTLPQSSFCNTIYDNRIYVISYNHKKISIETEVIPKTTRTILYDYEYDEILNQSLFDQFPRLIDQLQEMIEKPLDTHVIYTIRRDL